MRAGEVLQKCLSEALAGMHSLRSRVLIRAVEALIAGRRLTLFDLARSWPDAERMRAPLKALDRLLSNRHLHSEREHVYAGMARWLIRSNRPVIIIDWADLKGDRSWHVLRAGIPISGRTLTLLDMVFPKHQQGSPGAEQHFLQRLAQLIPANVTPVLVTDSGFRAPWFRAVTKLGWHWVGRLRHRTHVKPVSVADEPDQWVPCKALYAMAGSRHLDLGLMHAVRFVHTPLVCRLIVHAKPAKGRKHLTCQGKVAQNSTSLKHARREKEPWLLMASPELTLTAAQMGSGTPMKCSVADEHVRQ
ncbi:IS4 family transposase [Dyella choica]|uniref:IS4 family transposase n=1 Tax=Dyella choica TaxID=1927959 RepID=A0A3S0WSG0_9GAMM|nr:IS4 family transposase [Dyella choica]RUL69167.1 IS4 family transposase [Dyella choica]